MHLNAGKLSLFLIFAFIFPCQGFAGLDISAYSNLKIVNNPKLDEDGFPVNYEKEVLLSPSTDFPEQFAGLQANKVYSFKSSHEFRAGSYSGYNYWRNELAKLAGYKPIYFDQPFFDGTDLTTKRELRYDAGAWAEKSGPFWELINFTDSDGVIGPSVCKKLLKDFVAYKKAARKHSDEWFKESYYDWMKAFSLCAQNGAVVFH